MADRRANLQELKPASFSADLAARLEVAPFPVRARYSAQRYGLPPGKSADFSAHAEAEDRKLRKDLTLEVLALKVPFRNLLVVSESSPVAGTIEGSNPSNLIRCRTRTRVAEMRPASHTNALGELFIAEEGGFVQGKVCPE